MTRDPIHRPDDATDDPSLGLPRPAVRGPAGAGITKLGEAWATDERELRACHGTGPKAGRIIRQLQRIAPPAMG